MIILTQSEAKRDPRFKKYITSKAFTTRNCLATFGIIDRDGEVDTNNNHACHAGLREYAKMKYPFIWNNFYKAGSTQIFLRWLTDPVLSPWRLALEDAYVITSQNNISNIIFGPKTPQILASNLMIAGRMGSEHNITPLFKILLEKRIHPNIAFLLAHYCFFNGDQKKLQWSDTHQGHRPLKDGSVILEKFITGDFKTDQEFKLDWSSYCNQIWYTCKKEYNPLTMSKLWENTITKNSYSSCAIYKNLSLDEVKKLSDKILKTLNLENVNEQVYLYYLNGSKQSNNVQSDELECD